MISMVNGLSLDLLFETTREECFNDVGNPQVHYGNPRTIFGGLGLCEELVSRTPFSRYLE